MDYEWDSAKAAKNLRVHGVDFIDAIPAIEDPNRLEEIDDRFDYDEERTLVIGLSRRHRRNAARREPLPHHFGPKGHAR